jgi:hypothetical protein
MKRGKTSSKNRQLISWRLNCKSCSTEFPLSARHAMTRAQKIILASLFVSALSIGGFENHTLQRERTQLVAQRTRQMRLEADVQLARHQRDETRAAQEAVAQNIAATRALAMEAAAAAATTPTQLAVCVELMKQLFEEMPEQQIPELKLLGPKDWIQAAWAGQFDTLDHVRAVFSGLRRAAIILFGDQLNDALRRFTDASHGELPADIFQLAAYLTPPADREMLSRYKMTRAGIVGSPDEPLIVSLPSDDGTLSITLGQGTSFSRTSNATRTLHDDADSHAAVSDLIDKTIGTTGSIDGAQKLGQELGDALQSFIAEFANEALGHGLESLGDNIGPEMTRAAKEFSAAHPGETPTLLSHLRPYYADLDKVAEAFRPFLARMEYFQDHDGKMPTDPAQLQPYLDKTRDPATTLRLLNFTIEDHELKISLKLDPK